MNETSDSVEVKIVIRQRIVRQRTRMIRSDLIRHESWRTRVAEVKLAALGRVEVGFRLTRHVTRWQRSAPEKNLPSFFIYYLKRAPNCSPHWWCSSDFFLPPLTRSGIKFTSDQKHLFSDWAMVAAAPSWLSRTPALSSAFSTFIGELNNLGSHVLFWKLVTVKQQVLKQQKTNDLSFYGRATAVRS